MCNHLQSKGNRDSNKMEVNLSAYDLNALNPECTNLTFERKAISTIKYNALHGFHFLQHINLSFNKLEQISSEVFRHCHQLRVIRLQNNRLKFIPKDLFYGLPELIEVNVSDNQLRKIDRMQFSHNRKLEIIFISYNQIKELHPETFWNFPKLRDLYIRHNQLTTFNFESLKCAKDLHFIWFEHNELTEVMDYERFREYFPALDTVSLTHNRLHVVYLRTVIDTLESNKIKVFGADRRKELHLDHVYGIKGISDAEFMAEKLHEFEGKLNWLNHQHKTLLERIVALEMRTAALQDENHMLRTEVGSLKGMLLPERAPVLTTAFPIHSDVGPEDFPEETEIPLPEMKQPQKSLIVTVSHPSVTEEPAPHLSAPGAVKEQDDGLDIVDGSESRSEPQLPKKPFVESAPHSYAPEAVIEQDEATEKQEKSESGKAQ